ncbi:MAG: LOG family protein [Gloeomargarita sp. SKYBB_i_bin120]|nr:LOG family protein [Gloeomargarita sp. SKYG98]MCS7292940.1 LOG family protein [Gloeomargarita sp. SKYB120]MDW8178505.1 LOG family protein [Gloeomargarita sp. SKYBB_i_bin120]
MTVTPPEQMPPDVLAWLAQLDTAKHGKWMRRALESLLRLSQTSLDRLDWKIIAGAIQDMEQGFRVFQPYRQVRKIALFGSARIGPDDPNYQLAVQFARCMGEQGFMVMTGAGGGIMQAGNEGAGTERSFGLNIQLPFEQGSNAFVSDSPRLINFKYFFTRKLFFLRETDAVCAFPGGFGTQDEVFEALTLCQNGRCPPIPIVLLEQPGGTYWRAWDAFVREHFWRTHLISPDDVELYTITDSVAVACQTIRQFYRVYHSSRYVRDEFVLRLHHPLAEAVVAQLNEEFADIVAEGVMYQRGAFPEEMGDETDHLPRLVFRFNQRDYGRLYQLIRRLNESGGEASAHPEWR